MSIALLDVNALLALLWENQIFHAYMAQWFASHAKSGWATCPITEQGFVRIVSNPAFIHPAPAVRSAIGLLEQTTAASGSHYFWADDIPLSALSVSIRRRLQGPKQITDAYLLALAMHHKAKLVTFDYRMEALAEKGTAEREALVILRP